MVRKRWHKLFAHRRQDGEWFDLSEEEVAYFKSIKRLVIKFGHVFGVFDETGPTAIALALPGEKYADDIAWTE